MTRGRTAVVVGLAYSVLLVLATWQAATGRADVDAPVTFAAAALVAAAVAGTRPSAAAVARFLAGASALLSAWTLAAFALALADHVGEPASFYAVKVAVVTPVAAHNVLASLLLVGLVAATVTVAEDRRWWAAVVVTTLALPATLSRGATLVGLLLPVGAVVVCRDRRLGMRLAVGTITALALVLVAAGLLDASVPDPGAPTSVVARGQLWAAGWDAFTSHPLVGVGFDGFRDHAASLGMADPRDHAHDLFLHAGATGGVVAVLAATVPWAAVAVGGWRSRDEVVRALALLGGGVLFAHALVEETAFRPAIEVVLAVLVGLVLRSRHPAGGPRLPLR